MKLINHVLNEYPVIPILALILFIACWALPTVALYKIVTRCVSIP